MSLWKIVVVFFGLWSTFVKVVPAHLAVSEVMAVQSLPYPQDALPK